MISTYSHEKKKVGEVCVGGRQGNWMGKNKFIY